MSFDDLPDDKLYEICETMNDTDLIHFSESQKRIGNVCGNIIQKRKELRLASEIGKLKIAMKYETFKKLLNLDINFSHILLNLSGFDSSFVGDGDDDLTFPNVGLLANDVPKLKPINSTRSDYSVNEVGVLIVPLIGDEKRFFDELIKIMIKNTSYIIGLNPDNSLKLINIPFECDTFSIMFSSESWEFSDFFELHYRNYYHLMVNYLL